MLRGKQPADFRAGGVEANHGRGRALPVGRGLGSLMRLVKRAAQLEAGAAGIFQIILLRFGRRKLHAGGAARSARFIHMLPHRCVLLQSGREKKVRHARETGEACGQDSAQAAQVRCSPAWRAAQTRR